MCCVAIIIATSEQIERIICIRCWEKLGETCKDTSEKCKVYMRCTKDYELFKRFERGRESD